MTDMIGIGTDLVDLSRFREVLARTPTIVNRLFTVDEQAYCGKRNDPTERFAARFAAKEATMKALGVGIGEVTFKDIEVIRAESGQPSLLLTGSASVRADFLGVHRWLLTLTHSGEAALAIAVALGAEAT